MQKGKRKSYPINLKLEAIKNAKKTNNHAIARLYNIDHTQISRWRVKEEEFKDARKASRRVGSAVTPNDVKFHMTNLLSNEFKLSYSNALNTFKASDPWLNLFMNWFDLSLRKCTKTSQKLPKDLSKKLAEFHSFINELRINNNFELNYIANMDETPVYFDIVGAYTLDDSDGSKLPSMVIFKDKELMKEWLEAVWKQRPGGQNKRSLLVFDSFEGHLTTIVKNKYYDMNTVLGVIPSGLTSVVQPLNISINKPFKDQLREKWNIISNALDNSENHLIESNQTKKEEECVIDLIDENKENEESIATTSVPYANTERSYLIGKDETEIMDVLLY
ncbi:37275_t:CDS:2 [Gigaspora margarita]|uniref:37275_t:CDS:1 n=1 Tax=Gigaspora margarita TaxID=4874 RepID=A0ABN7V047_GIGMA|nr:37275_t:CDS:2 [Gigaspora margarita]